MGSLFVVISVELIVVTSLDVVVLSSFFPLEVAPIIIIIIKIPIIIPVYAKHELH